MEQRLVRGDVWLSSYWAMPDNAKINQVVPIIDEELRRANVTLPVLMMTGFAPDSVGVVAKRLGAMGVLKKPFDMDDLRTAVINAKLWRA